MTAALAVARRHHGLLKPPLPHGLRPPHPRRAELRAAAGIDGHLTAADRLLATYAPRRTDLPDVYALLDRIREHDREPRLVLGVVGEFSSGKSTLLNALLRDDLLRTDVLQGTTAAPTVIGFGPELGVSVRWLDAARGVLVARRPPAGALPDRDRLRDLIRRHSADEEVAAGVAQVDVSHPADCLRDGLVIVDLPGTNAENRRHTGVTAAALADFCDAALVVLPADAAGADSLMRFLTTTLEPDVLRRAVFVLNKIDLIRKPADREKLADNLAARLAAFLKVPRPKVVPAAPERVLEADGILPTDDPPDVLARWRDAFRHAERVLWAALAEQKVLLQVERLVRLLEQVVGRLNAELTRRDAEYAARHAAVRAGLDEMPALPRFIARQRRERCDALRGRVEKIKGRCGAERTAIHTHSLETAARLVGETQNREQLQRALNGPIQREVEAAQGKLRAELAEAMEAMEAAAENEHRRFFDDFQDTYRELARLSRRVRGGERGRAGHAARSFDPAAAADIAGQVKAGEGLDRLAAGGGAGVGAVIGTFVIPVPVLGTAIGAAVGAFTGLLFRPSHDAVRKKCWDALSESLNNGLKEFVERADAAFEQATAALEDALADRIDGYADRYRRVVDEVVAEDEDELAELEQYRRTIQTDLADLRRRQQHLSDTRTRLRDG